MTGSFRHSSARLRALALFALIAWISSTAAAIVDLTYFRHVRCAEHGETIHIAAGLTAEPSATDLVVSSRAPAAPSHGHDHCVVATLAQQRSAALSNSLSGRDAPRPTVVALEGARLAAHVAVEILSLAPKSSPPSLAS